MLFDTDIFIWIQRGNGAAAAVVDSEAERLLSVLTYMELQQGARNRQQHQWGVSFLQEFGFRTLPLTENIGHRAAIYIEEYAISHGLRVADAIIAATAVEHGVTLCSGNLRHFRQIKELKFKALRMS